MALPETARKADISLALGSGQIMCSLQPILVVVDIALDQAYRVPGLDNPARRGQPPGPDGLEEVDLELERGEGLALVEGGGIRHPHGGIGQIAQDAAVDRADRT